MIHRKVIVEHEYEPMGTVKQILTPFQMSETPPKVRWIPRYGEYTTEVFTELGFSESELDAFREQGVCE
jgi:crotonobetainyl-CoA:carnitine CoA-transferase CaiB-like acyl-CoA transferase